MLSESDIAETTDSNSVAPTDSPISQSSGPPKTDSGGNKGAGGSKDSGKGKGGGGGGGGRDGKGSGKTPEKSTPMGIAEALQFVKEVIIEFKKVSCATKPDHQGNMERIVPSGRHHSDSAGFRLGTESCDFHAA